MTNSGRGPAEDGGVWMWQMLRDRKGYRLDWAEGSGRASPPEYEPAPFPVRIQSEADLIAARWGLLAWQDPDGPESPFWSDALMLDAALAASEPPLLDMVEKAGSTLSGLRLACGALILKVERGPQAVQLRLEDAGAFPEGGGIELRHGIGDLRETAALERELWELVGKPAPPGAELGRS